MYPATFIANRGIIGTVFRCAPRLALAIFFGGFFANSLAQTNCPCTILGSAIPALNGDDPDAVELGVKFKSDVSGYVTGVRFYKASGNTGTHTGSLWSISGQKLASATFVNETATGWQQVSFATPVAIVANTIYVASYFAPKGHYSGNVNGFAAAGIDNGVLHALKDGVSGGNGTYRYGASGGFPGTGEEGGNYFVDVTFVTQVAADVAPPTIVTRSPAVNQTNVAVTATASVTFNEALDPTTVSPSTFQIRDGGGIVIPSSVAYSASTYTATITPTTQLANGFTYTVAVAGGSSGTRVKDVAGNALAAAASWTFTTVAVSPGCSANPIAAENCLPGNPSSQWDVTGAGDATVQGFATQISVNRGTTVTFKVKTTASAYRFDIYRMGYYGGMGARKVATVSPSVSLPQTQPNCLTQASTGLIDCGNWAVSGSWAVPATATSGIYFAKLVRTDTGGASHIFFIVRDDSSTADIVFQTSDTTWQAYNTYGGNSLYQGGPGTNPARAYKVSYNRPFTTRANDSGVGVDWVFNAEYPMVRWLESNGYNMSYITGVDSDRSGGLIRNHKIFLSVGHDEYWSAQQRTNVESARNAGVHLAFFSANNVFWKTRWENAIDGSGTAYRTLVSYKETHANAKIDPTSTWTGTWADPRFSPPADGGKPQNALTGTLFGANGPSMGSIEVPAEDGKLRFWRNTDLASLPAGGTGFLPYETLGYEWDIDPDNGFRPAGLIRLSRTVMENAPMLLDYGSTFGARAGTHYLTLYRHGSGALVFGAGTIQWSWGLDEMHDRPGTPSDVRMQQATANLFADMGVQPATLQPGLVAATASTDTTAPTASIVAPTAGKTVSVNNQVVISGTATDVAGRVAGMEVSVDGGSTWHPANGRTNWSYGWTPTTTGVKTISARAIDDSGNLGVVSTVSITVATTAPAACPCSIWTSSTVPAILDSGDIGGVEVGVKFRSDVSGFIRGIRFYKAVTNTGTHIGNLWTVSGQRLATGTFTGETASGWQQLTFASPVAVTANTVYVASYFAPNGHYSGNLNYFSNAGTDNSPLHALKDGISGVNGAYRYSSSSVFPSAGYQGANYWVDVIFTTQ